MINSGEISETKLQKIQAEFFKNQSDLTAPDSYELSNYDINQQPFLADVDELKQMIFVENQNLRKELSKYSKFNQERMKNQVINLENERQQLISQLNQKEDYLVRLRNIFERSGKSHYVKQVEDIISVRKKKRDGKEEQEINKQIAQAQEKLDILREMESLNINYSHLTQLRKRLNNLEMRVKKNNRNYFVNQKKNRKLTFF